LPVRRRVLLLGFLGLGVGLPLALALSACAHDYLVEDRLTPVHVWLSAPEIAARGGGVDALVYVGGEKVVEGPVAFAPGVSTVTFPTIHVNSGSRLVQVVLARGTITASQEVNVTGETWIHVTLDRGAVRITSDDEQPLLPR
jgi:hypothetical protein